MKAAGDDRDPTLSPKLWKSNPHRSELGELQSDDRREDCKRREPPPVTVCDSGSASQGMNLSPCPFLTWKSPRGPGGCGKWEARSLLNSCVIEFPHNTAYECMLAGTSVPRAQRVKQGAKIPRGPFGLEAITYGKMGDGRAEKNELPSSIRSRKSAHGWEKNIHHHLTQQSPCQDTITSKQTQMLSKCLIWQPLLQVFPTLAIHICRPCARLPGGPPC